MKKRFFINILLAVLMVASPYIAFAAHNPISSNVFSPTILQGPLLICTGVPTNGAVASQCNNLCDLVAQIANVIYFAIAVVIWIITPILVAFGGIMIMIGGASSEMIGRGKKTITGAVWGIVIVLCAYLIVYTFVKAIGITGVGGFGVSNCNLS
jgi:hypothetical protein